MINSDWIKLQDGLYLEETTRIIHGVPKIYRTLHSADGYCFYDAEEQIFDEEGNLINKEDVLPKDRTYYQKVLLALQMSYWSYEQLNNKWISVIKQDNLINKI